MAQASRGQVLSDLVILRDRLSDKHLRLEIQSKSEVPISVRIKMKGKPETEKYRKGAFGNAVDTEITNPDTGNAIIHPGGALEYIITRKMKHPAEVVHVIVTYVVNNVEKKANFTFSTVSGLVWSFHGTYSH